MTDRYNLLPTNNAALRMTSVSPKSEQPLRAPPEPPHSPIGSASCAGADPQRSLSFVTPQTASNGPEPPEPPRTQREPPQRAPHGPSPRCAGAPPGTKPPPPPPRGSPQAARGCPEPPPPPPGAAAQSRPLEPLRAARPRRPARRHLGEHGLAARAAARRWRGGAAAARWPMGGGGSPRRAQSRGAQPLRSARSRRAADQSERRRGKIASHVSQ